MAWRPWSASRSRSTYSSASSRGNQLAPGVSADPHPPSVNCLFWQIGWLQRNIHRSSLETLLTVAAVVAVCLAYLVPEEVLRLAAEQLGSLLSVPAEALLQVLR